MPLFASLSIEQLIDRQRVAQDVIFQHASSQDVDTELFRPLPPLTIKPPKLGTISGVFVPCLQNIFGIILFVRVPWIVGKAGVGLTLAYLTMAVTCTTLTTISMSAIATNGLRAPGGAYYMISRSLGKDIGGAVGVLFYLSTAVAVSVYILGAVEVFVSELFPATDLHSRETNARVYGSALLLLMAIVEQLLNRWVHKIALGIFSVVAVCLVCILTGAFAANRLVNTIPGIVGFPGQLVENFWPSFQKPDMNNAIESDVVGFVGLFALFFPCVTGIMAGTNKSGVLKHPHVSIPRGTLAAIAMSTLVYVIYILLFGTIARGELLRTKKPATGMLSTVVAWPHPILGRIGCFLSALGAAFQCYTGAPRVLKALGKDDILPGVKGKIGRRRSALVTLVVCAIAVLIGDLDVIAQGATMCFLVTYTCLNLSTALLAFLNAPNWRPTWRHYHWTSSVLGGMLCFAFMFLLHWLVAVVGVVVVVLLRMYFQYRGAEVDWGDGIWAYDLQMAQNTLLDLERKEHYGASNWRPQIIAFVLVEDDFDSDNKQSASDPMILSFLSQLKKAGGLSVVCHIIIGDFQTQLTDDKYHRENEKLKKLLGQYNVSGFSEILVCESFKAGITHAIQTAGMGVLRPNTVVLGLPTRWTDTQKMIEYVAVLRNIIAFGKVVLLLKNVNTFPINSDVQHGFIDIYWIVHDGGILTILPFLLKKHTVWRHCRMRIFAIAQLMDNSVLMKQQLKDSLYNLRIEADIEIVELGDYDISEFVYEKTLQLEERQKILQKLQRQRNQSVYSLHPLSQMSSRSLLPLPNLADKRKVDFMNTSVKINCIMKAQSSDSDLIFCNLPAPAPEQTALDYLEYLDVLCTDLKRVVLVKGSGNEVISKFF